MYKTIDKDKRSFTQVIVHISSVLKLRILKNIICTNGNRKKQDIKKYIL